MCRTPLATALLTFALAACVPPTQIARPSRDPQLITQDEIAHTYAANAYDVIHTLRANFLSQRGETSFLATSSPYPSVYVDGMRYGTIDALRGIPAMQIASIRLYRSWDAMTRYGNGNMGGVIAITTRLDTH
jgi:outer membrane receptor for ferrienterochelin and colicin